MTRNKMNGASHFMIFLLMTDTTKETEEKKKIRSLWIIVNRYWEPNLTKVTIQRTNFHMYFSPDNLHLEREKIRRDLFFLFWLGHAGRDLKDQCVRTVTFCQVFVRISECPNC